MNTISVTLGSLVDRTLLEVQHPSEEGYRVVMGSTALTTTGATTFTLSDVDAPVNVSDLVQFGSELVLVTAKTTDADPVYTCARGYYSTTASTYAAGQVGIVNPKYPRVRVQEAIKRSFSRFEALGLPMIDSAVENRTTGKQYIELPAEVREVLQVWYVDTNTGKMVEVPNWRFVENMPTSTFSTANVITLPTSIRSGRSIVPISNSTDFQVVYRIPYRWSTHPTAPTEAATISVHEGAEDLPALYAAAWLMGAREFSRHEIDRSEEFSADASDQRGSAGATVRAAWQSFYRALDELRRLNNVPVHRPFIKRPKL